MRFDIKNDLRDANRSSRGKNPNSLITRQHKRLSSNSIKLAGNVKPAPAPTILSTLPNSYNQNTQTTVFITALSPQGKLYGIVRSIKPKGIEGYFNDVTTVSDNLYKVTGVTSRSGILILSEYSRANSTTNESSNLIRCFEKDGDNMVQKDTITVDNVNDGTNVLSDDGTRLGICYVDGNKNLQFKLYTLNETTGKWNFVKEQLLFAMVDNYNILHVQADSTLSTITITYKQYIHGYTHIMSIDNLGNLTQRGSVVKTNYSFNEIYAIPVILQESDFIIISTVKRNIGYITLTNTFYDYINGLYVETNSVTADLNK